MTEIAHIDGLPGMEGPAPSAAAVSALVGVLARVEAYGVTTVPIEAELEVAGSVEATRRSLGGIVLAA